MELVAEGIETESQRALLAELGVTLGQGFLLGRPMPEAEVRKLLG
jgi:EAL domain-containing protein (putative c-di-GMP-specific phosphodiesterase class I)